LMVNKWLFKVVLLTYSLIESSTDPFGND